MTDNLPEAVKKQLALIQQKFEKNIALQPTEDELQKKVKKNELAITQNNLYANELVVRPSQQLAHSEEEVEATIVADVRKYTYSVNEQNEVLATHKEGSVKHVINLSNANVATEPHPNGPGKSQISAAEIYKCHQDNDIEMTDDKALIMMQQAMGKEVVSQMAKNSGLSTEKLAEKAHTAMKNGKTSEEYKEMYHMVNAANKSINQKVDNLVEKHKANLDSSQYADLRHAYAHKGADFAEKGMAASTVQAKPSSSQALESGFTAKELARPKSGMVKA